MRKLSEAMERVDVGRFSVAGHRSGIQNDTVIGSSGRFSYIATRTWEEDMRSVVVSLLVIKVEGHSVANEVLSARLKTELFIDFLHTILIEVES